MSVQVDISYSDIKECIDYTENMVKRIYANRRYQIAEKFIEYCTPFVPVKDGHLREGATIVDNGYAVEWSAINPRDGYDYAQIQYENEMFQHPKGGSAYWDREMMFYEGDAFLEEVKDILTK